jgi:hypothetical protein
VRRSRRRVRRRGARPAPGRVWGVAVEDSYRGVEQFVETRNLHLLVHHRVVDDPHHLALADHRVGEPVGRHVDLFAAGAKGAALSMTSVMVFSMGAQTACSSSALVS